MFESQEHREIPNNDLLSWTFGNDTYDHNKPVSYSGVALLRCAANVSRIVLFKMTIPKS